MLANMSPARRRSAGVSALTTRSTSPGRLPAPSGKLMALTPVAHGPAREMFAADRATAAAHGRRTEANDREVDEARAVAELALYEIAHRVELLWCHGAVVRTALACEVLALAGHGQRVKPRSVAEVHVSNHADVLERLQVAIHRADVRGRHAAADPFSDLLGGHRSVGGQERLQHEPPSGRHAKAPRAHDRHCAAQVLNRERPCVGPSVIRSGSSMLSRIVHLTRAHWSPPIAGYRGHSSSCAVGFLYARLSTADHSQCSSSWPDTRPAPSPER